MACWRVGSPKSKENNTDQVPRDTGKEGIDYLRRINCSEEKKLRIVVKDHEDAG
jgi:uncharacterized protein YacL